MTNQVPAILCDTVQSVGVHNGIVRITFIRLDADGEATPALELFMPVSQIMSLAKVIHATAPPKGAGTS